MEEEDNVLFVRGSDGSASDDVWDDSALIRAYDKAINLAKVEVSKRINAGSKNTEYNEPKPHAQKQVQQIKKNQKKWCIGSPCRAIFSEDGQLYEAVIIKITENTGTCIVKFIGYNNKEKVDISSLLESEGLQSQIEQKKQATATSCTDHVNTMEYNKQNGSIENEMDCDEQDNKSFKSMYAAGSSFNPALSSMPPAPPLPPQLMARLPENDGDALSSMLMSWYISGFHTGYYHGLKQAEQNQGRRKK